MKFSASYEVPESVATTLKQHWDQIAQKNLEDLALIGYRSGILTAYQVQLMLHHDSRWETEEFLHKHQCALHYNEDDFERDGKAMQAIRAQDELS